MFESKTVTKIAKNTIFQIIGKVISMSITILAVVIITRTYGREGFGAFSLMQSWPALFFVIVDFGINAIAARELSKDWSKANKYFGNILIIRLVFSLLIIFLVSLSLRFFPYSDALRKGIGLGLFVLLTQALFSTANIFFQVKLRYDFSQLAYTLGYIVILGLVLTLSYLRIDVMWVNFSYVVGGVVTFILCLLFVSKLGVKPEFSFDRTLWKFLFVSSFPIGIMFVFSQIGFKADALMISFLKLPASFGLNNTESVAVYSLPYKVFEVFLVIPTFFMNAVYPVLVGHMVEGKEKIKKTFTNVIYFLVLSGILIGVLGVILSPMIIKLLGGYEFSQSVGVLKILSLGLIFFYLTSPISWLIVTLGYQKRLPAVYLISATFNIVCNLFIIPKYSFYGASWVTVFSECIVLFLLILAARKSWKEKYA